MNTTLKTILAVLVGMVVGSSVNMGVIMISAYVIPPPEGVDMTTAEGIKAAIDANLLEPKHYIMPFFAHAFGTLAGAVTAVLIAASHKLRWALVMGGVFLIGGIAAVFKIPAPTWFIVLDLAFAYLPMAWLGHKIMIKKKL